MHIANELNADEEHFSVLLLDKLQDFFVRLVEQKFAINARVGLDERIHIGWTPFPSMQDTTTQRVPPRQRCQGN
jgi:hypothetical protein